jgi:hypothetical protein
LLSEEKRERRKSATLTKPPSRGAVLSGASSTKSEVSSMVRKDKDRESVRTATAPATPTVPSIVSSTAPGGSSITGPAGSTAATAASTAVPSGSTLIPATPRESLSPGKGKDKDKKVRRLSDIGIFSLWKRKPEKDKAKREKQTPTRASTTGPDTSHSTHTARKASQASVESKTNQAATAKTESAASALKPATVEYDGPALTKSKSATLPPSLMRLPSFEFDRPETVEEKETNGGETPKANGNGNAHESAEPTSVHDSPAADETGALTNLGRLSVQSQTIPARASTGGSGLGRLARKLTSDSNNSSASKPKDLGPPPKIQLALDFPSIAWPSMLDNGSGAGGGDRFAGSDFLADVQKDIGQLMAGGLGMSFGEEQVGDETTLGRSRSPVPQVITEEPESRKTPEPAETKESGDGNGNGKPKESVETERAPALEITGNLSTSITPVPPVPPIPQASLALPSQGSPRSPQPQHTRFLVLSKSTTLSTSVKLYTIGGLKVEDDGDIGGGRLTFFKVSLYKIYMCSSLTLL